MTVAVLSPHLDDAALSAWSALRGGHDVVVVNVFDGVPPEGTLGVWDRVTGASDSSRRMRERLEEDRQALAVAGGRATSVGLLEEQYRTDPLDTDAVAAALDTALPHPGTDDGPAEVWAPAGIGRHIDHVMVRDWALRRADAEGVAVRLYADLPYAVRHGWPSWVTGDDPDPHFSHEHWWERQLPAGVGLDPAAHTLANGEAKLKLTALESYRTQFFSLGGGSTGVLRNPRVIGYEVSWAVGGPAASP